MTSCGCGCGVEKNAGREEAQIEGPKAGAGSKRAALTGRQAGSDGNRANKPDDYGDAGEMGEDDENVTRGNKVRKVTVGGLLREERDG